MPVPIADQSAITNLDGGKSIEMTPIGEDNSSAVVGKPVKDLTPARPKSPKRIAGSIKQALADSRKAGRTDAEKSASFKVILKYFKR